MRDDAPDACAAPTLADIHDAASRLRGRAVRTPLLESDLLNDAAGRRVLVKAESLQRTGSFKFRGAWSKLTSLDAATRARGVVAISSGNHAQGVALAARLLGVRAVIVMPADAPAAKREGARALGAELALYDRAGGEDRDALAASLCAREGMALAHPFDDPAVIAGQGTVGLEIAEQAREAGVARAEVLVCCGGGGLTSGVALALEGAAPGLRVRPVEPEGFDDVARSLRAGAPQRNARSAGSVCDAILTPAPGRLTLPVMARLCGPGIAVSDDAALSAMAQAFARLRLALEPGGAVALAAALTRADLAEGGDPADPVMVVASGGNVDPSVFSAALALV
ncbi:threonine ammonia-lyase [Rubrimonas sp.]|uniref:threonine ammonia-lyase n=1 Tax=Rubrimonas sp. TaxID=2036015 RepID=UPI002FDDB1A1